MIMSKLIIEEGESLKGEIEASGAKNVALKTIVAGLLTDEKIVIENIPLISDLLTMKMTVEKFGGRVEIAGHKMTVTGSNLKNFPLSLEMAAQSRTSSMIIAPLLLRFGKATIPNPGGCRIGARPIDRHIEGLSKMGAKITYDASGYFHAQSKKLHGTVYTFPKNTHTGTETLILAAVLANGETVLENAAAEPEVDDLIGLLNQMGAKIKRVGPRTIKITGVKKLGGTTYKIMPDRNEVVTFAVAGIITGGDLIIKNAQSQHLLSFLEKLDKAGAGWEKVNENSLRFFYKGSLKPCDIVTSFHPGFMTDWQAPWTILMTQAAGKSTVHEAVFESRFGYVSELRKMGVKILFFQPKISCPEKFYNFNMEDKNDRHYQAILIEGPIKLHNAILNISDLRAGATLVLAALAAEGESVLYGAEHIDRGYERFEERLKKLGAKIKRANS